MIGEKKEKLEISHFYNNNFSEKICHKLVYDKYIGTI